MRSPTKDPGRDERRESYDLYMWGFGGAGALGNSAFRDELDPFLVSSLRAHGGVTIVSCGFEHTVAVTGDLRARAWGRAAEGQLGLGCSSSSSDAMLESPRGGRCMLAPSLLGMCEGDSAARIQAVAAGGMHTVLMSMPRSAKDDPVIFSCGRGNEGQLGSGPSGVATRPTDDPAAIETPTELPTVGVAAGGLHSTALSSHGHLFVWGDNSCGQLGLPPLSKRSGGDRAQVPEGARAMKTHALAPHVAAAAERAASTSAKPSQPPLAVSLPHLLPSSAFEGRAELEARVPITVSAADEGGKTFVVRGRKALPLQVSMIACGQYHTVGIAADGSLFSWGANSDGQLGLGDFVDRGAPCKAYLPPDMVAQQAACGGRHTIVLGTRGEVVSCGCNTYGQLGHGTNFGREALHRMAEVDALFDESVVQLACGGAHTAAVTADGWLYTWGKNQNGQLGHGNVVSLETPTRVAALGQRAVWVACGGAHTGALCRLGLASDQGPGAGDRLSLASDWGSGGTSRSYQPSNRTWRGEE
jgi:alpha-tubulin suppressor-like RCC1 family protein